MSYNKPNLSLYPNLRNNFEFMEINEIRASFMVYKNGKFPWNRDDDADIVPVKISYATSNIQQAVEFYINVLEGKLLYLSNDIISSLDDVIVSYAFIQPINDFIEFEYIQRPIDYTYGEFTTELYKNLLINTHNDIISTPFCGLDRWFDNHYGFNTLKFAEDSASYDYMDRVLDKLIERQLKYRLYYTPYEDESPEGKYWMSIYGFNAMYTLYVFDMNGQTIQMIGWFAKTQLSIQPPIYNKQWCYVKCPGKQTFGLLDEKKIYHSSNDDIVSQIILGIEPPLVNPENDYDPFNNDGGNIDDLDSIFGDSDGGNNVNNIYIITIAVVTIGIVICIMMLFCIYRCIMKREDVDIDDCDL